MLKRNTIYILVSALVLVTVATLIGTVAYFSKSFTSDNNVAKAAVFDVDVVGANGETIADAQFDLKEDLTPGMDTREVLTSRLIEIIQNYRLNTWSSFYQVVTYFQRIKPLL
ncbi:hypothetical protein E1I69_22190 [Bacillus timonensis]|uniref:Uncharacterized protein n=1 Tax=Bacillus timonensis TaxID=1033734 RepID=A0A4S3PJP3_9BACI|nr:hypothetical protein [Bacillus timonensis]THE09498.1 hypothetical protein E1I69_22190 [Bacillus timonensis]